MVGYVFYLLGTALPICSIADLIRSRDTVLRVLNAADLIKVPSLALWIGFALPVVASLLTSGGFFSVGHRLQMSTTAVERLELARATKAPRTQGRLEVPDVVKLDGSLDS